MSSRPRDACGTWERKLLTVSEGHKEVRFRCATTPPIEAKDGSTRGVRMAFCFASFLDCLDHSNASASLRSVSHLLRFCASLLRAPVIDPASLPWRGPVRAIGIGWFQLESFEIFEPVGLIIGQGQHLKAPPIGKQMTNFSEHPEGVLRDMPTCLINLGSGLSTCLWKLQQVKGLGYTGTLSKDSSKTPASAHHNTTNLQVGC